MLKTCREVQSLLPLFFDSELDARQMRVVALHSARCSECEGELRGLERLQEVVASSVSNRVDELDLVNLWPTIERQLGPAQPSWFGRLRLWWEERPPRWLVNGALMGAAAAGFALALVLLRPAALPISSVASNVANESAVTIDSIESDSNVALLREADTLVLWLDEDLTGTQPVSMETLE